MSSYGVVPEGFREKTLDVILNELSEAERTAFGANIDTDADSVLGHINGLLGDQIAQLWEVALAVYRSLYPDSASAEALDNVAALTGAVRLAQQKSTVLLKLNTNNGTVLPAGRVVSVGADGTQWQTSATLTNATGVQATLEVPAESVSFGPIVGNAYAIDTIQTPVAGWSARAPVDNENVSPFVLANGQTLIVAADGGADQTVTFLTADFAAIGAATHTEVAAKLNAVLTGITTFAQATGKLRVFSNTFGAGSSIQIKGGTSNAALGFTRELHKGFNWNQSAKHLSSSSENYALANGQTLTVKVDGGGTQTVTFLTADFVAIGAAKAREVAVKLTAVLTGAFAYAAAGKVLIESLTAGVNSSVEVTGGTANTALGFSLNKAIGETHDAIAGRNTELDADFRVRREELLRLAGVATVEAIRAAVRDLLGVTQVIVFENATDSTDADGLPPHSFEVVVSGGDDTEVAQTIFDTQAAGIATHRDPGANGRTVVITDSQNFTHSINFTRPSDLDMWIDVDIVIDAEVFGGGVTSAGIDQVKDALKTLGDSLSIGDDVIVNRFLGEPFDVAGVIDVTDIKIDDVFPPVTGTNFIIAARQVARFSTARITVNVS
jgi:hypothetical protein